MGILCLGKKLAHSLINKEQWRSEVGADGAGLTFLGATDL